MADKSANTPSTPLRLNWNELDGALDYASRAWRVRLRHWLPETLASSLQGTLGESLPWDWAFQQNGTPQAVPQSQIVTLARAQISNLWASIHREAAEGFQFSFRKYSIVEALRASQLDSEALHTFIRLIANAETISSVRTLTGCNDIARVDAQATRYDAGDFLTVHTDDNDAKYVRRVAYVLNLSRVWRADWGGLLHFHDEHGRIIETFVPEFNTLNLFSVPQSHSVSMVTPFAGEPRLAITGWFTA
jgi:SM-20-related protein